MCKESFLEKYTPYPHFPTPFSYSLAIFKQDVSKTFLDSYNNIFYIGWPYTWHRQKICRLWQNCMPNQTNKSPQRIQSWTYQSTTCYVESFLHTHLMASKLEWGVLKKNEKKIEFFLYSMFLYFNFWNKDVCI